MSLGTVYLVGAGPGDAGLLTLRAMELIESADVIVYDRLVGGDILALIPDSADTVDVGKNAGNHPVPQEEIGAILVREAKKRSRVVRLKGGDPFVFGRGGEEAEVLAQAGIAFEIVPGVTSAIAAPAYAGIPVTHRNYASSLHIITGHGKNDSEVLIDYASLIKLGGTLVFMMSVATAPVLAKGLMDAGMDKNTPAAVIENGTTPRQRSFVTGLCELENTIKDNSIKSPAVIVVGDVSQEGEKLEWLSRRPLSGCSVLVTRPRKIAEKFGAAIRELGAQVTFYPCIETKPLEFDVNFNLGDWVIFTSAAGVDAVFRNLWRQGSDTRKFAGTKIAAVGKKTAAALEKFYIRADFIPEVYDGASLARELLASGRIKPGQRAVLLRAKDATDGLLEVLRDGGAEVCDIPVYETVYINNPPVNCGDYDFITFTSASSVGSFANSNAQADFAKISAVCIGRTTAAAAEKFEMQVTTAKQADTESMVSALLEVWRK